jgi:hypothetical protein
MALVYALDLHGACRTTMWNLHETCWHAAVEIERLQAENAALKAALEARA